MDNGAGAGWGHVVSIPIVLSDVELFGGGDVGIDAGSSEYVACDGSLGC